MFDNMVESIQYDTVRTLVKSRFEKATKVQSDKEVTNTVTSEEKKNRTVVNASKKIRPNDPCPCGSGKKYKFCCGK